MKVKFELEGTMQNGKPLKGIMTLRMNTRSWLKWCKEGSVYTSLETACQAKIKKQFKEFTMGVVQLPSAKSHPHLDFNKFNRLGLLGKETHVVCTTNYKGMFGKKAVKNFVKSEVINPS